MARWSERGEALLLVLQIWGTAGPQRRHSYAGDGERAPRGERMLSAVGARRERVRPNAGGGRSQAGPASAMGREGRRSAQIKRNSFFFFLFTQQPSKAHFDQVKDIFRKWPQNKSCSKFHSLQHCFRVHFEIPTSFWNRDLKSIFKSKLYFGELFLEVYFGKAFKINFAPNCFQNISKLFTLTNKHIQGMTSINLAST
jgi:hypothetical protein